MFSLQSVYSRSALSLVYAHLNSQADNMHSCGFKDKLDEIVSAMPPSVQLGLSSQQNFLVCKN